jgi:hypothetical protein
MADLARMRGIHTNLRHTSRIANGKKEEERVLFLFFFRSIPVTKCVRAGVRKLCGWTSSVPRPDKMMSTGEKRCTEPFDFLRHSRFAR